MKSITKDNKDDIVPNHHEFSSGDTKKFKAFAEHVKNLPEAEFSKFIGNIIDRATRLGVPKDLKGSVSFKLKVVRAALKEAEEVCGVGSLREQSLQKILKELPISILPTSL